MMTRLLPVPADICAALDQLGQDYRIAGGNARIRCPWHDDRSPSCYVHLGTGLVHCFACGARGQFARLVQKLQDASQETATLWCQTRAGGLQRLAQGSTGPSAGRQPRPVSEADLALYSDPPDWALEDRALSLTAVRDLGILWEDGTDRWIIPLRGEDGTLAGWQEKGQARHDECIRPRGIRKPLFGLREAEGDTGLVVEAPLDVARLRTVGVRYGVAAFGARISAYQLGQLTARFSEVIFAFDNDPAGWDISGELRVSYHRLPVYFFNYGSSDAKDPGDMARSEILSGIADRIPALRARF